MTIQVVLFKAQLQMGLDKKSWTLLLEQNIDVSNLTPIEYHIESQNSYYGFYDGGLGEDGWGKEHIQQWLYTTLINSRKKSEPIKHIDLGYQLTYLKETGEYGILEGVLLEPIKNKKR